MKKLLPLLQLLVLLACSCDNEDLGSNRRDINFSATIEQIGNEKGAKVHLVDEQWVYWDVYDEISIGSDLSTQDTTAQLVNTGVSGDYSDYNGIFVSTLDWGSQYFLGLYPYHKNNNIRGKGAGNSDFYTPRIYLPRVQPYASDITFARDVFPMVAWYGGTWSTDPNTPYNLDFHSLAGLVRLQLFNQGSPKTIDSITVTSRDRRQLWGPFDVANYKTFDPHVTATSTSTLYQTISISGNGTVLDNDTLCSFYLVVPADKGMDDSTLHHLTLRVIATDGTSCTCNFTVGVRRNGITYMRALGVSNWVSSGNGTAVAGLVGNGTEDRPFKIYSVEELAYLRNAFNSTPVRINNQAVGPNTYFRIMRSNIVLNNSNWTSGIANFTGHLDYYGANSDNAVIVNNSSSPLFESIAADGEVKGIIMSRTNTSTHIAVSKNITPFCLTNRGTIEHCEIQGTYNSTTSGSSYGLAGICIDNYGTIRATGSTAEFTCNYGIASGICLNNHSGALIEGCYTSSVMSISSSIHASGICDNNAGTIRDCYFAARITGASIPWGGIAYTSSGTGSIIQHCYFSHTATVISTSSVGGIVHTLNNSRVDYCWNEGAIRGAVVAPIAAYVENGGVVRNCYCDDTNIVITVTTSTSAHFGGGLVAQLGDGGAIQNSYVHIHHMAISDNAGQTGGLVGNATGGTVDNCYVYEVNSQSPTMHGGNVSPTYSNSHLVGGSASLTGVTNVAIGADNSTSNSNFTTLTNDLNNNTVTGYSTWVKPTPDAASPVTVPILADYTE